MIKQWERRTLTPLGKITAITAIKVLMIPLFIYFYTTYPRTGYYRLC